MLWGCATGALSCYLSCKTLLCLYRGLLNIPLPSKGIIGSVFLNVSGIDKCRQSPQVRVMFPHHFDQANLLNRFAKLHI